MSRQGFTLIELSIVLVVIGLIVGGILTGRDLIEAASVRAQMAQLDKYNTAVHTFQAKYGYIPGDIPEPMASKFGFQTRGTLEGQGDGNGVLEANCGGTPQYRGVGCNGELGVFWEDLSTAGLIDAGIKGQDQIAGNYPATSGGSGGIIGTLTASSSPPISAWLPFAKIGSGNYVYVYSMNYENYFAVSAVSQLSWEVFSAASPGITVQQAYNIDKKLDDGLPQSGRVIACFLSYNVLNSNDPIYAAGAGTQGMGGYSAAYAWCTPDTTAVAAASKNCFDNGGVGGGTQKYSTAQNGGTPNCALSFKFQ
ncbi:MAG TPA: prepilin-type N-terminal cleavage/methylation domain-containing protein [Rickettsiales bacterium]|nr:prepilin-type N-terminal cleavage/methylation domain-containing protein [Rickettsiales bacterium]